jgi:hypothetical protein
MSTPTTPQETTTMSTSADIQSILVDLEQQDVLVIRDDLTLLDPDAAAMALSTDDETQVTITSYGTVLTAAEAIVRIDEKYPH